MRNKQLDRIEKKINHLLGSHLASELDKAFAENAEVPEPPAFTGVVLTPEWAEAWRTNLTHMEATLEDIVCDPGMDQSLRNKKGVELHNRVERAKEDLQAGNERGLFTTEDKTRMLKLTRRLLTEIFRVPAEPDSQLV